MFQTIQVQPLVGKWAAEARREIPIDYLEEFCPNQEAWESRCKAANEWRQMGLALKLYTEGQGDQLRLVQEFFARTPPHMRCPCGRGVKLTKWEDHYYRCDAKHGLKHLEEEKLKFQHQIDQVDADKRAFEEAWGQEAARTKALEAGFDDSQVVHMSTAFLQKLRRLAREELQRRYD